MVSDEPLLGNPFGVDGKGVAEVEVVALVLFALEPGAGTEADTEADFGELFGVLSRLRLERLSKCVLIKLSSTKVGRGEA